VETTGAAPATTVLGRTKFSQRSMVSASAQNVLVVHLSEKSAWKVEATSCCFTETSCWRIWSLTCVLSGVVDAGVTFSTSIR